MLIGADLRASTRRRRATAAPSFTIDAQRERMLTALVERPPAFGARVAGFDASAAEATPGVVAVREVPEGVAVYAENTWAAMKGRRALSVQWNDDDAEKRSTDELFETFRDRAKTPGLPATDTGDAAGAIRSAGDRDDVFVAEAEYAFPYLAHASMEPLDALIEIDPEGDGQGVLVTMGWSGAAAIGRRSPRRSACPSSRCASTSSWRAGASAGARSTTPTSRRRSRTSSRRSLGRPPRGVR